MSYKHFTVYERECLALLIGKVSVAEIARILGRDKSSVYREIKRNSDRHGFYSPSAAERQYRERRENSVRKRRFSDEILRKTVSDAIIELRWSPEQIVRRAKRDDPLRVGVSTIYRAVASGVLPKAAKKALRHGGRRYKKSGDVEKRGQIKLAKPIEERPEACEKRLEIGHFESDSVEGKKGGACLSTHVDRKSRYLCCAKTKKNAEDTADAMISLFSGLPVKTFTPDRGKEFAKWEKVQEATGAVAYFPPAGSPWKRGTNENTNGLLRQFFPKGCDFDAVSDEEIARAVELLNGRPRKCLGYKTPAEVWAESLHLQ